MSSQTPSLKSMRSRLPVLVMDAHALGSIAVIRSLGAAGYSVHACARETIPKALGLHSNFARHRTVCPEYGDSTFITWLRRYVTANSIRAIIPSEGFLLAIRPVFEEFSRLLPIPQNPRLVYDAMSKAELFSTLLQSGTPASVADHLPKTIVYSASEPPLTAGALSQLRYPLFLKVDATHSRSQADGAVIKATDLRDAISLIADLSKRFTKVTIQEFVSGHGVGAFFLINQGQTLAHFMHLRLHEVPHNGGASSYRRSFVHEAILSDALSKLTYLRWQGVAMMEYRWDRRTDDFWLMEMNARFWGSLHLALHSEVDFPRLLLDAHFELAHEPAPTYGTNVRCRHAIPSEIGYVLSVLRDRSIPKRTKLFTMLEFVALSLNIGIKSDLIYPGDRSLFFRNAWAFAIDTSRALFERLFKRAPAK